MLWKKRHILYHQCIMWVQAASNLLANMGIIRSSMCSKKWPTWNWWLVVPHGWSLMSLSSGKVLRKENSLLQVHLTPRCPEASQEGEGLGSAPLMERYKITSWWINMKTNYFINIQHVYEYTELTDINILYRFNINKETFS